MSDDIALHLGSLKPADPASESANRNFWSSDLTALAEHHTAAHGSHTSHSYVVAHDGSATWGVPGEPQMAAIKVARDLSLNTFTLELTYHATTAFAQNWLIEHGCPPERIAQTNKDFMLPADDLTVGIEQQIRESGTRYKVLGSQTWDSDPCETWTVAQDSGASQAPIRVYLEEGDDIAHTYTLREGAFATEEAALDWLDDRSSPLPKPPEYRGEDAALRTGAALARSAGSSGIPKAGLDVQSPPAGPVQRPNSGRSI
ncbi:glycosyl hydrolase [Streptomyces sp. NPDC002932]|uniref:glycosyl hydrolase n=1 Tax=Streptomyces sp. NPDC002932 TaxID=3364672 RepID=UPI00367C05D3